MEYPVTLPKEVIEFVKRLTNEERKTLSALLKSDELKQIEEIGQTVNGRRHGDPNLYIGTTPKGLNLEIPDNYVNAVFVLLLEEISPSRIEIFLSGPADYGEVIYTKQQFVEVITENSHYFSNLYALIEMDENEIVTSGEGCISIAFSGSIIGKRHVIATRILDTCGYTHRFETDKFYAVVWKNELEIKEFPKRKNEKNC